MNDYSYIELPFAPMFKTKRRNYSLIDVDHMNKSIEIFKLPLNKGLKKARNSNINSYFYNNHFRYQRLATLYKKQNSNNVMDIIGGQEIQQLNIYTDETVKNLRNAITKKQETIIKLENEHDLLLNSVIKIKEQESKAIALKDSSINNKTILKKSNKRYNSINRSLCTNRNPLYNKFKQQISANRNIVKLNEENKLLHNIKNTHKESFMPIQWKKLKKIEYSILKTDTIQDFFIILLK